MGNLVDLKEKFKEYFNEVEAFSLRSERFYADLRMWCMTDDPHPEHMAEWLEAAFIAGCRAMAQDTIDTLGDYATTLAGVDEPKYNITEAFDKTADSLMVYYTQALDAAEKSE